jgi:rhamnogalacturonan endolyase
VVCSGTAEDGIIVLTSVGDYIKVTCSTSTLTHYFVVHNGDPIIHMATYITAG